MSKDKKTKPISSDTARKIWLAGVGAYGRAFGEAQEQLSKVTKGGGKMFDDLVQKGEVIETMVSYKGKEAMGKVSDKFDKVSDGFEIDERIAKMRSRLKRTDDGDMGDVEDRLDVIEAKLDAVLELLKPKKTVRKRAPAKKTATKKTATKKTVAKKPAAKKKPTAAKTTK